MKKAWVYYKGVRKFVFLYIGFLVAMEVLGLIFPMLLKNTAELISKDYTNNTKIITSGLLVFAVVVLIFIVNFVGERFGSLAVTGYQKNLRIEMFEKLQHAPVERVNEIGSSSILPVFMNDTSWVRQLHQRTIVLLVYFPVAILGSVIMLFNLNLIYGIIGLATLPLVAIFFLICSRRLDGIMQKSIPAFDTMHIQVKEGIVGAKEIRIFNKAKQREKDFAEMSGYNRHQTKMALKATHLSNSFTTMLYSLVTAALIVYGAYTMNDISQLIILNTAIQYVNKLWTGTHYIFTLFVDTIPRSKIAKGRITRIFNLPFESSSLGLRLSAEVAGRDLQLQEVNYVYPNGVPGLTNINIKIDKNTRVAVTGKTGSGRSLLPHLLLQYKRPASGKITIGDTDIYAINPPYYRRNFIAFCDQVPEFVPGTIRENLAILSPDITDEQILKFFSDIGAQAFIKKFDNFLDYKIRERDGFNMATKKLLNLARTILKPAQIYVFNQCFDHVNPEYIAKIFTKLRREKKTCLFVTQNNLVNKHCDKVYVFKDGAVCAAGTHSDLLKESIDYRDINFASAGKIISEEVTKEICMVSEDIASGGSVI